MKKIVLGSCLLSIIVMSWFALNKKEQNPNLLAIGILSGYKPFAVINSQGTLEGFDIDVAKEIGKRLEKDVVFKDLGLATLFIALEKKTIDLLISSLSITPARQEVFNMVHYYGAPTTRFPMIFWENAPDISTIEQFISFFPGETILVEPGSAQESFLMRYEDQIAIKRVTTTAEKIMNLSYGKARSSLVDPEIIHELIKQTPELKQTGITLPEEYQSKGAGIGINKQNSELATTIKQTIKEMKTDGTIKALQKKWGVS